MPLNPVIEGMLRGARNTVKLTRKLAIEEGIDTEGVSDLEVFIIAEWALKLDTPDPNLKQSVLLNILKNVPRLDEDKQIYLNGADEHGR